MYSLEVKEGLDKAFSKLSNKDKTQLIMVHNKVQTILEDPYRFKPLKSPMENKRRAHIGKSFVLVYEIDEQRKTVTLLDYDHHDNVYQH